MYYLKQEKDKIRSVYLEKRALLPSEFTEKASLSVCRRIATLISYRYSDTVLLYCPIESELNILPLFDIAKADKKRIAFPKCRKQTRTMKYYYVNELSELTSGAFGIREPSDTEEEFDNRNSDRAICIIPALVYDKYGYRLGYGGGYYDRFLQSFRGTKIGTGFSDFILDKIPHSRYDAKCDVLVTEKGVRAFYEV